MLTIQLKDGHGAGYKQKVNKEGTIGVVIHQHPPLEDELSPLPFRQFLTSDGEPDGPSDMRVVGTLAAPIDFFIKAQRDVDIYIKTISIEITDANATLDKFGNVSALTNGVRFVWLTGNSGEIEIAPSLKTNWDFVRLAGGQPAFAENSAGAAFRASNVSGNSEGYIPVLDMGKIFGLQYGIRLRKGTNDALIFQVRDTTTGVDSFNIIGLGITL